MYVHPESHGQRIGLMLGKSTNLSPLPMCWIWQIANSLGTVRQKTERNHIIVSR